MSHARRFTTGFTGEDGPASMQRPGLFVGGLFGWGTVAGLGEGVKEGAEAGYWTGRNTSTRLLFWSAT